MLYLLQSGIALFVFVGTWRIAEQIVELKYLGKIVNEYDKLREKLSLWAVLLTITIAPLLLAGN